MLNRPSAISTYKYCEGPTLKHTFLEKLKKYATLAFPMTLQPYSLPTHYDARFAWLFCESNMEKSGEIGQSIVRQVGRRKSRPGGIQEKMVRLDKARNIKKGRI